VIASIGDGLSWRQSPLRQKTVFFYLKDHLNFHYAEELFEVAIVKLVPTPLHNRCDAVCISPFATLVSLQVVQKQTLGCTPKASCLY
jgi:hypothetical protein